MMLRRMTHVDRKYGSTGMHWALGLVLVGTLPFLSACSAPESHARTLTDVAAGGDHQDWDQVRPDLQAYLLERPDDPVAHYYYGLSFLHRATPQLTYAEGEFLTALRLLDSVDEFPEETLEMTRGEFAGLVHRKAALVYMRGYREALRLKLPESYGMALLEKSNTQVELGLKADPDSGHLKEYSEFLRKALGLDSPKAPKILTKRAGSSVAI